MSWSDNVLLSIILIFYMTVYSVLNADSVAAIGNIKKSTSITVDLHELAVVSIVIYLLPWVVGFIYIHWCFIPTEKNKWSYLTLLNLYILSMVSILQTLIYFVLDKKEYDYWYDVDPWLVHQLEIGVYNLFVSILLFLFIYRNRRNQIE